MKKLEDRKKQMTASHDDDQDQEEGKEREFKAGRKEMEDTKEEQEDDYYSALKLYGDELAKSEGFEVSHHPALKGIRHLQPYPIGGYFFAHYKPHVLHAIDCYNRKNKDQGGCGGEVEFIEFLNIVGFRDCCPWRTLYSTFLGRDYADGLEKTYQASVCCVPKLDPVLTKFRLKPQEDNNRAPPKNPFLDFFESLKYNVVREDAIRDAVFWRSFTDPLIEARVFQGKDLETYFEELETTQGYDITGFSGMTRFNLIVPIAGPWDLSLHDRVTAMANDAIDFHNNEAGSQLELVTVDNINIEACAHPCAYITFKVNDGKDGRQKIYQAKVKIIYGWKNVVQEVRLKPY